MQSKTTITYGCVCCPMVKTKDKLKDAEQCELCWHWHRRSEMYNPTKGVYVCQMCWF